MVYHLKEMASREFEVAVSRRRAPDGGSVYKPVFKVDSIPQAMQDRAAAYQLGVRALMVSGFNLPLYIHEDNKYWLAVRGQSGAFTEAEVTYTATRPDEKYNAVWNPQHIAEMINAAFVEIATNAPAADKIAKPVRCAWNSETQLFEFWIPFDAVEDGYADHFADTFICMNQGMFDLIGHAFDCNSNNAFAFTSTAFGTNERVYTVNYYTSTGPSQIWQGSSDSHTYIPTGAVVTYGDWLKIQQTYSTASTFQRVRKVLMKGTTQFISQAVSGQTTALPNDVFATLYTSPNTMVAYRSPLIYEPPTVAYHPSITFSSLDQMSFWFVFEADGVEYELDLPPDGVANAIFVFKELMSDKQVELIQGDPSVSASSADGSKRRKLLWHG